MSEESGKFLMEKTWEKIQEKTFTKWVNSHLRKRKLAITQLKTDFGDGVNLIQFLEIISSQTLPKYEKKPKIRIQKIGNVAIALKFLESQKIRLVNISPEDIVDENLKLILGLIWTIIQKFQIDDISEEQLSAKEALLLWCQKKTAGYKDCKVENFTWSFQDGLALCALIHRHRPDLLDYSKLSKDNKAYNLQLAFDVADRDLGIPKLLDVEDMVDIKPDERSVITYVSQYYHVFSKYNQAEVAGRRIGKLVDLTEALDAMKNDYGNKAKSLVDWINKVTPQIEERNFDNTLEGVQQKIEDFKQYKKDDKPPKVAEKANVEALFNNINLKLRSNNRSPFEPPAGLAPADIEKLWNHLGDAEGEREKALQDELRRQQKLAYLRQRFNLKAGKFEAWLAAKEQYLGTQESVNSLNEAQTKLKNHDAFDNEYSESKSRLDTLQSVVAELLALNPSDAHEIQSKGDSLASRWSGLAGPQATKRADLDAKLAREQRKEELRLEFAKLAKEYNVWNKEKNNEVNNHHFGDNLEAVQAFRANLDSSDADVSSNSTSKKDVLDKLWDEMQSLGVTENRYSPITNKNIENAHQNLLKELERRRAAYEEELQRQILMEQKRKEFAQKAQEFVDSLNTRRASVDAAASSGEAEDAISAVRSTYADGKPESDGLAALSALQNELSALGIRDNKYTQYSIESLTGMNQKFANSVKNTIGLLQDEQELKHDYNTKADALVAWGNGTLPSLGERNFDNTLEGARNQHTAWQKYVMTEKTRNDIDRINLGTLFQKIQTLLSSNKRPAFAPSSPKDPASISALWDQINAAANAKETAINEELSRQEKLHTLVKRFNSDADDLTSWAADKEGYLNAAEQINNLDSARMSQKLLEVFSSEFNNKKPALESLRALESEIVALKYHDVAAIQARTSALANTFARFEQLRDQKKSDIDAALAREQAHEDLRISFANQARDFSRFIRESVENSSDSNFGVSLDSVTAYKSELDSQDAALASKADSLKGQLDQTSAALASAGVSDNRHTALTQSDVESLRAQLSQALQKRREAYNAELQRQTVNESKRKAFAEKANHFVNYVDDQKKTLQSLSGTPDERLSAVASTFQEGAPAQALVDELSSMNSEMQSLGIYDNVHTSYPLPAVKTRHSQYVTSVRNFQADLKEEKEFNERAAALQAEYEHALKLENLRISYQQGADALHLFLESSNESLTDPIRCDTVGDVKDYQTAYDQVLAERPAQQQKYDSLVTLASQMASEGVSAGIPISDLTARWNSFLTDCDSRKAALEQELARQNNNESLRVQYATKAKALHAFIQQQSAAINSPGQGELEDQLKEIQSRKPAIHAGQSQVNEVGDLSQRLTEAGVTSNQHTDLLFASLKVDYDELVKLTDKKEALIQKEIIQKENSSVSAEQLAEFKEVFEHFDKDRTGSLNRLEFKSCLQSLGEDYADAELDKLIANIGTGGKVPFEAFVQFMSNKAADSESQNQILDAFKTLAGDKEFVTEEDLRRALAGEKVDYLVKNMPLYKGQAGSYDYTAWATRCFA